MEFILILFLCPFAVVIASIIGFLLIKKWYVMPTVTLILFTILTFTVFNETFFFWVVVYTIISIIVSLFMKVIKK
ncbi:MAG: DUF2651 family protein [Solibacillus sp.]|uniref:DUF2651 family protein n=1 Tax=Solibacillus sp. TaxID=1909654 RepID=UPI0033162DCC